jgi:hypothetical protein
MCAATTLPGRAGLARTGGGLWTTAPGGIFALVTGYGSGMVDGPVPDSAMDTKSEDGEPGDDERDSRPLDADEQAILERLRAAGATPPEEEPGADTTLPPPPPAAGPDPLDPIFREPNP